jgi:hypothetical protein
MDCDFHPVLRPLFLCLLTASTLTGVSGQIISLRDFFESYPGEMILSIHTGHGAGGTYFRQTDAQDISIIPRAGEASDQ